MTPSRLLKSWATPPARRPTASIFCAWRNICSMRLSSLMSLTISEMPTMRPAESLMGGGGQQNVNYLSVFSHGGGFELLQLFAPSHPSENAREFILPVGRDHDANVPANDLGRGIAVYSFRAGVPSEHDSLQRRAHDCVEGGLHDRGQPANIFLFPFSLCNVPRDAKSPHRAAFRILDLASAEQDRKFRPIPPDAETFALPALTLQVLCLALHNLRHQRRRIPGRNGATEMLPKDLFFRIAIGFQERAIRISDVSIGIAQADQLGTSLDNLGQQVKPFFGAFAPGNVPRDHDDGVLSWNF